MLAITIAKRSSMQTQAGPLTLNNAHATKRPPKASGGLPVLGHGVDFVRDTLGLLRRVHEELGEIGEFKVAHRTFVLMTGPEAAEAVFRAPDEQLSPNEAYKMMVPVFGKDVAYDNPPARMNEQLGMFRPALQDQRMRTYGEIVAYEVRRAIDEWADEGEIDLVEFCASLTNYTSTHCLIGKEFRERMSSEFATVYQDLERGITPLAYINAYLPLPSFRRRDRARVRLQQMITEIVAARRTEAREGEDFLQTLMDARYKSGAPLSEHEITGMLLAAMFAGHHTSSVTTAWTLLELLRAPDYLDRVLEQLHQVYANGNDVTFASLRQITLTDFAVKEALRLHPPLFMLLRVALQDFVYKDYLIPEGNWIITSPYVSHRLASSFADPERFDPDRFAPGREEDKKQFAFISFGGGRHKCMGNAFALLQVKTIFAILLRAFEFKLGFDPIADNIGGVVMGPKTPCRVRYRRIAPKGSV
jgi:sterol 14-demethylase